MSPPDLSCPSGHHHQDPNAQQLAIEWAPADTTGVHGGQEPETRRIQLEFTLLLLPGGRFMFALYPSYLFPNYCALPLPDNTERRFDQASRAYFANHETSRNSWNRPLVEVDLHALDSSRRRTLALIHDGTIKRFTNLSSNDKTTFYLSVHVDTCNNIVWPLCLDDASKSPIAVFDGPTVSDDNSKLTNNIISLIKALTGDQNPVVPPYLANKNLLRYHSRELPLYQRPFRRHQHYWRNLIRLGISSEPGEYFLMPSSNFDGYRREPLPQHVEIKVHLERPYYVDRTRCETSWDRPPVPVPDERLEAINEFLACAAFRQHAAEYVYEGKTWLEFSLYCYTADKTRHYIGGLNSMRCLDTDDLSYYKPGCSYLQLDGPNPDELYTTADMSMRESTSKFLAIIKSLAGIPLDKTKIFRNDSRYGQQQPPPSYQSLGKASRCPLVSSNNRGTHQQVWHLDPRLRARDDQRMTSEHVRVDQTTISSLCGSAPKPVETATVELGDNKRVKR